MFSCAYAVERVKLRTFLTTKIVQVSTLIPKPCMICAKVYLATISHPWTSLLRFNLKRDFIHEVGFRLRLIYIYTTLKNELFFYSNYQLTSFIFCIFCLVLLIDCFKFSPALESNFSDFLTSWSANLFLSIPLQFGTHWIVSFFHSTTNFWLRL